MTCEMKVLNLASKEGVAYDWDISKTKRDNTTSENINNISTSVPVKIQDKSLVELKRLVQMDPHQVDLGQNTNRSCSYHC